MRCSLDRCSVNQRLLHIKSVVSMFAVAAGQPDPGRGQAPAHVQGEQLNFSRTRSDAKHLPLRAAWNHACNVGESCDHAATCRTQHAQELAGKEGVEYIPGGATQNSIRVAQWVLQAPGATAYFGCIGSDDFGSKMRENAKKDGVNVCVWA